MTDPRIAIVEGWYCARLSRGPGHRTPEQLLSKLDSARPEPTESEIRHLAHVLRTSCKLIPGQFFGEYKVDAETWESMARAVIAALPPSGALGLARELVNDINRIITPEDIARVGGVVEKARALVAMLGGEK